MKGEKEGENGNFEPNTDDHGRICNMSSHKFGHERTKKLEKNILKAQSSELMTNYKYILI